MDALKNYLRLAAALGASLIYLSAFGQGRVLTRRPDLGSQDRIRPNVDGREAAIHSRPSSFQAGSPWPKFHQNNLNTGVGLGGGSNGLLRWKHGLAGTQITSSPAIGADGTVYVGSTDSNLYAIHPDGTQAWAFPTGNKITSSPAIGADGTIYVGSTDNYLYAISPSGSRNWRFQTGNAIDAPPTIGADGTIYVGSTDDNLYAVSSSGVQQWEFSTKGAINSSPAIGPDGTIYVTSEDTTLYALKTNGTQKWNMPMPMAIEAAPVIGLYGEIYVACTDNNIYMVTPLGDRWTAYSGDNGFWSTPVASADGILYVGCLDNYLYAIDEIRGRLLWKFQTSGAIYSSPAIGSDGTIYVGSDDKNIYAINPDGSLKWNYLTGGTVDSSPAIGADGAVYVGDGDGNLYSVGSQVNTVTVKSLSMSPGSVIGGVTATGTVTLSQAAPSGGDQVLLSSGDHSVMVPIFVTVPGGATSVTFPVATTFVPSVRSAVITALSVSNSVTANLALKPPLRSSPWSKYHQNNANTGLAVGGNANGVVRWTFPIGAAINSSAAISTDGTIYVAAWDFRLYALNSDGTKKWRFLTGSNIFSTPAIGSDGTIYVSSQDGNLYALNPDGTVKWQCPTSGGQTVSSPAIGSDGTIYVGATTTLYAISSTGSQKWAYATGGNIESSPAIGADGTIYVGSDDENLYALNPGGKLSWKFTTTGQVKSSPAIDASGLVYFGSGNGYLYVLNSNGTQNWSLLVGGQPSSPAFGPDGSIYLTNGGSNVYAISSTGTQEWTYSLGNTDFPSNPVVGADGTIYVGAIFGAMTALNPDGTQQWMIQPSGGSYSDASVGADGVVYFWGTDGNFYAIGTEVTTIPVSALTLNPNWVVGGANSVGTVTLTEAAPSGGDVVFLNSSSPLATVPAYVYVQGGAKSANFTIKTTKVATVTPVVIAATSGSVTLNSTLNLTPPIPVSLTASPNPVAGGLTSVGTVQLSTFVPGDVTVTLSSNNSNVIPPATVIVPNGQYQATFTINTNTVGAITNGTIKATVAQTSVTTVLQVLPPYPIRLTLAPNVLLGGTSSTGTVTLNVAAPNGGLVVNLASNNSNTVPPTNVTVAAGATSATFTVATSPVSSVTPTSVSATVGSTSVSANLTINPATISSITVAPTTVTGGSASTATATLNGPAGPGGT